MAWLFCRKPHWWAEKGSRLWKGLWARQNDTRWCPWDSRGLTSCGHKMSPNARYSQVEMVHYQHLFWNSWCRSFMFEKNWDIIIFYIGLHWYQIRQKPIFDLQNSFPCSTFHMTLEICTDISITLWSSYNVEICIFPWPFEDKFHNFMQENEMYKRNIRLNKG